MIFRGRALSLVVLLASLLITWLGLSHFAVAENEAAILGWFFLGAFGAIMTISSTFILLLSCFAVQMDASGAFVVKRHSPYGQIFFFLLALAHHPYSADSAKASYCAAFWMSNLFILLATGGLFVASILGHLAWMVVRDGFFLQVIMALAVLALLLGAIIGALHGLALSIDKTVAHMKRHPRVELWVRERTWLERFGAFVFPFGVLLLSLYYLIGAERVATALVTGLSFLLVCAIFAGVVLGALAVISTLYRDIAETQFGRHFSDWYHRSICPFIRVID